VRTKKGWTVAGALVLVMFVLAGCSTLSPRRGDFRQRGPKKSVLVFDQFFDTVQNAELQESSMIFMQLNTEKKPQVVVAKTNPMFNYWTAPNIEPGGSFKLVYYDHTYMNIVYYSVAGIQGKTPVDFIAPEAPGLFFCGRCVAAGGKITIDTSPEAELKVLKIIQVAYVASPWFPIIRNRIKELEK